MQVNLKNDDSARETLSLIRKSLKSDNYSEIEEIKTLDLPDEVKELITKIIFEKDKKVYTLSGGEQQRIALARLIIKKCDLILCDEPTGSLDRINGERIMSILWNMNKEGKTVVLVTHDEKYKKIGGRVIDL